MPPAGGEPPPRAAAALPSDSAAALAMDLVILLMLAVAMLLVAMPVVNPSRFHVSLLHTAFNDQVGYVTAARSLLDGGHIRPHVLLTSALWREPLIQNHQIYQPGHFALLAAAYRAFGYGVWQSFLPNLLGYVLTTLGAYALARRAGGRVAGYLAALAWLAFPPGLLFAWSAMAELTFIAAATLALVAFLALPDRLRPLGGPLLLLLPFLIRDTGCFLAAPMTAVIVYGERGERRDRPARGAGLLFLLLSVGLCLTLYQTRVCQPRTTTMPGFLLERTEVVIYQDAVRQRELSRAPISAYVAALQSTADQNQFQFQERLAGADPGLNIDVGRPELSALLAVLALTVLSFLEALRGRRPLAQGISVTLLCSELLVLFAYEVFHLRGLRMVLFPIPAVLAILAAGLAGPRQHRAVPALALALCVGGLCLSQLHLRESYRDGAATDRRDDNNTAFLESLKHDERTLLVAPYALSFDYYLRHYPVDGAYLPANRETLHLMLQHYTVGTMVLPEPLRGLALTHKDLREAGFVDEGTRKHPGDGSQYRVFRKATGGHGG